MKNQDWLKEMLGIEFTMKENKMMFGRGIEDAEDIKQVEFFTLDLDEKSVTSVKTGEKFYPENSQQLQDIVINIKEEQKIEEELHEGCFKPIYKMEQLQIKLEALKLALQMQGRNQAPLATSLVKEAKIIEQYLNEK